ncbi:MAG: hypothetical protein AB1938_00355 [Myxococcota bacterium]
MMRRGVVLVIAAAGLAGCIDWLGAEEEFCRQQPTPEGCPVLDAGQGGGGGGTGGGGEPDAGQDSGVPDAGPGTPQITFKVVPDGGITGEILWMDGGLLCDGNAPCVFSFDAGTQLTFRGKPGNWAVLVGFRGCSAPVHGACELTVTADATVEAYFDRPNLVFVTSTSHQVGGFALLPDGGPGVDPIAHANSLCAFHAADAGLPGNFIALLATNSYDPLGPLSRARGWIRVDGKPVFDRLTAGSELASPLYPVSRNEFNGSVTTNADIASGLTPSGGVGSTCSGYTSPTYSYALSVGSATFGGSAWFSSPPLNLCNGFYRLACFGTDRSVPVQVDRSQPTNLVFVTTAAWRVDGGVPAADALCAAEGAARTGSDAGTFVAFLSTSAQDAFDRLGTSPRPWARSDGVVVIPRPSEFRPPAIELDAPFSNSTATYFWVGSTMFNCGDWLSSSSNPRRGRAFDWTSQWYLFTTGPYAMCSDTMTRLACFQR